MNKYTYFSIVSAITLVSCSGSVNNNNNNINNDSIVEDIIQNENIDKDMEHASKVLNTLPEAHEIISILLDHPDTKYDASALNSDKLNSKYTTTISKALNIGIYGTDMSYASLFEQNQTVLKYMAAIKIMADELGILQFFDEETMRNMEENLCNKETMIELITNAYYSSDKYLIESGQREIASLIISGAWVEGMYTAFYLSKSSYSLNPNLSSRILKQCLDIPILLEFFENTSDSNFIEIKKDFEDIKSLTDSANIKQLDNGLYSCDEKYFKKLYDKVLEVRKRYVAI
ncbi:MAG: hypothetical protein MJ211_06520 [Bacteroidales bacterium]|nr:hypothetical protein [Bacteroidales bacterium]